MFPKTSAFRKSMSAFGEVFSIGRRHILLIYSVTIIGVILATLTH